MTPTTPTISPLALKAAEEIQRRANAREDHLAEGELAQIISRHIAPLLQRDDNQKITIEAQKETINELKRQNKAFAEVKEAAEGLCDDCEKMWLENKTVKQLRAALEALEGKSES